MKNANPKQQVILTKLLMAFSIGKYSMSRRLREIPPNRQAAAEKKHGNVKVSFTVVNRFSQVLVVKKSPFPPFPKFIVTHKSRLDTAGVGDTTKFD